ncbi:MAG: glycosyl hydrolase family 88 [Eubacterium sp.]|nr:glycosyl hydrolase family 88 [Eubacterium sp.]
MKKTELLAEFDIKAAALKKFVFDDPYIEESTSDYKINTLFKSSVVFISVTDGNDRAAVFNCAAPTLESAWDGACALAKKYVGDSKTFPLWLKTDILNDCKITDYSAVRQEIRKSRDFYYKKGISFDVDFYTALLEAQLNCGGLIDYNAKALNLRRLREHFSDAGNDMFVSIPEQVVTFTTIGYICDEDMNTYKLYPDEENYGRRVTGEITSALLQDVIAKSSAYLSACVDENGRFDYGVNPVINDHFTSYNILRHTGTVWSIIMQYQTTGDETLVPKIDSALEYMMNSVEQPDDDHAYLVERKADEIKLGGNAIMIITLSTYMDVFGGDKYKELIRKAANSILDMQEEDGSYFHVLSFPDYARKDRDRIVYYDGEATFALARAYGIIGDEKYLDGARKALDYFIANGYTRYADHWIAYSINEVTLHDPQERYLNFGLKNANDNLNRIFNQDTTFHTFLELLMATFELYSRIKEQKLSPSYLSKFNFDYFMRTIFRRIHYMLNGFLYPEIAMYMKYPLGTVNTFCVRHDSYRVRIDDVQHYIGGYFSAYKHFDELKEYYDKLVQQAVVREEDKQADDRAEFVKWILDNI